MYNDTRYRAPRRESRLSPEKASWCQISVTPPYMSIIWTLALSTKKPFCRGGESERSCVAPPRCGDDVGHSHGVRRRPVKHFASQAEKPAQFAASE